jgi:hypothetical protein
VASNSVPVAIGSRRIFAVPLDLAYRNLDADAMAYARFAPKAVVLIGATTLIGKCGLTIADHPHH